MNTFKKVLNTFKKVLGFLAVPALLGVGMETVQKINKSIAGKNTPQTEETTTPDPSGLSDAEKDKACITYAEAQVEKVQTWPQGIRATVSFNNTSMNLVFFDRDEMGTGNIEVIERAYSADTPVTVNICEENVKTSKGTERLKKISVAH